MAQTRTLLFFLFLFLRAHAMRAEALPDGDTFSSNALPNAAAGAAVGSETNAVTEDAVRLAAINSELAANLPSLYQAQSSQPSQAQPTQGTQSPPGPEKKQSKRILGIIPNFESVSAGVTLPPLSPKQKIWVATESSFDYTAFIYVAIQSGIGEWTNSYREFGSGGVGYGRYYWHFFADQAVEDYMVQAAFPIALHQDPRYYTLGHGGFFRRTAYAVSRLFVTRTDSGDRAVNFSELVGAGAAAGISSLYYPSQERTWTKIGQRWLTQETIDGVFYAFQEFWPDIRHAVFHQ